MAAPFFPTGKVLIVSIIRFLGKSLQIKQIIGALDKVTAKDTIRALPLSSSLTTDEQARIFTDFGPHVRKVVVATNIAETSITIDDIVVVIDGGKYKSKVYDPYTQMSSLQTVWVPRSSAKQRAGRCTVAARRAARTQVEVQNAVRMQTPRSPAARRAAGFGFQSYRYVRA